ncbi:MAG: hypothetical protein ABI556_13535 [Gemmatimonadales bacterium]
MQLSFSRAAKYVSIAAIPFVFAAALPLTDGMTYEFVMKSTSKQTGNKEQVTMRGRGTYAGDDAKLEILEAAASSGGSGAFGGKGTYFIVKNGGAEMFLVNPAEKSYMKWDMANMMAGLSKMMGAMGGLVKMQMSDVKIEAHDMGAGETIQGYPTKHMQMTQRYTMNVSMFGRSSKNSTVSTTDYYFSPALKIANPFVGNSQQMSQMGDMFNNPDFKTQMGAAMARMPKNGVPLKTITNMVSTDDKGKQTTSVTTMEMLNFKGGNIPASTFAIPHDYKMMEMPSLNGSMAGANGASGSTDKVAEDPTLNVDSATAAAKAGAKDAATEAAKAAAKEAAKKKLKGIFKR